MIIAAALACLVAVEVPAAFANPGGNPGGGWKTPPPAPGSSSQQPGQSSSSSSSGKPRYASAHGCSLYATSSAFGAACYQGGGWVKTPTVREILGGDSPNFCWDQLISSADLVNVYGYTPDHPYYMHWCLTGLNLDNSPAAQPDVNLSQEVIQIPPTGAHPCSGDPGKDQPYPAITVGTCIMTLTGRQKSIADTLQSNQGNIPGIVLTTHPSTVIHTNEWVTYADRANGGMTTTPKYQVGGVTMWAQMKSFSIHPYGLNGGSDVTWTNTDSSTAATPGTKSGALRWQYTASSAGQQYGVYPFVAEADWTVYFDAGNGPQVLGTFQKFMNVQLPVSDIQTIVVPVQ